jgi:type I restriction enzyme R subunit
MSNFTFLPPAFKDLAEASRKAEGQIMGDPRAACFHALQNRSFRGEL